MYINGIIIEKGCSNIWIMEIVTPFIMVRDATDIVLVNNIVLNNITTINSTVQISQNIVAGKEQKNYIYADKNDLSIKSGTSVIIDGTKINPYEAQEDFDVTWIDESRFVIKDTNLEILDLINSSYEIVQDFIARLYEIIN
jgi:hypothetical protein